MFVSGMQMHHDHFLIPVDSIIEKSGIWDLFMVFSGDILEQNIRNASEIKVICNSVEMSFVLIWPLIWNIFWNK